MSMSIAVAAQVQTALRSGHCLLMVNTASIAAKSGSVEPPMMVALIGDYILSRIEMARSIKLTYSVVGTISRD